MGEYFEGGEEDHWREGCGAKGGRGDVVIDADL